MAERTWLFVNIADAVAEEPRPHLWCTRCGERRILTQSEVEVRATLDRIVREFIATHRNCPEVLGVEARP